jgi:UDP-GlcNAc:undecaprenyl-phosphate/decaprenyl-phosphate GlcNAc-1-phosphate transferase
LGLGFCASVLLTPLMRRLAIKLGIIDLPVGLKIHKRATPLMGGVAVYIAFSLSAAAALPVDKAVLGLLAGGACAVIVGVLDEKLTLPPLVHLVGQIVAALVVVYAGIGVVRTVSMPFSGLTAPGLRLPFAIGLVLTVLWLVGMMNTMNFLDGLDGLAAGVAAISALLLAAWGVEAPGRYFPISTGPHDDIVMPLALAGALLGFLPYNWHRARIFLGDSGSMFLGLAIGALSIVGPAKLGTALLILIIPVLDVAWAIVRRQVRGRSFLAGDKQHVYHRMLELGMGYTTTVFVLYFLCLSLGALDLLLHKSAKLIAFVILAILASAAFIGLEVRATRTRTNASREPSSAVGE